MTATVVRSEYKGWYIEVKFETKIQKWTACFFDQYENRIVNVSDSVGIFDTPEEALIFAQSEVETRLEEEEITERFSLLIDEMLAKEYDPYKILWSLGSAIHKKRNELSIDPKDFKHYLW